MSLHTTTVGATGFEPATFRSQSGRATKLRHAPILPHGCPTSIVKNGDIPKGSDYDHRHVRQSNRPPAQPGRYAEKVKEAYTLDQFGPEQAGTRDADGTIVPTRRMVAWCRAVAAGFNEPPPTLEQVRRKTATAIYADATLTEVMTRVGSPDPRLIDIPVGTLTHFWGQINLGAGSLVDAAFFSEATVQTQHRRQGLLREMVTMGLRQSAEDEAVTALLTASSGALYGRFGFTNVVDNTSARVEPKPRFKLRREVGERVRQAGRVEPVTFPWLMSHAEEISQQFLLRNRCATTRFPSYMEEGFYLKSVDEPSPEFQAVVHVSASGPLDGYAIYSVHKETIMAVEEVVAGNADAELALWDHLAGVGLIEAIHYPNFANPAALQLALEDVRAVRPTKVRDALWARVLDPVAALEARPYPLGAAAVTPPITLTVEDPLGLASGTYLLTFEDGNPRVARTPDQEANLTTSVQGVTALVFGSATTTQLADAGLLRAAREEHLPELLRVADALFAPVGPSGFLSEF